uniref:SYO1-like TPR repeats domain-containing protein n=1 Tax=Graphocephala atropunctata TaxID=36148 RepID=A0A1B6L0C3_9HEMI
MGKAKPRHKKTRRHNKSQPTGIPSVKDTELEESDFSATETDKDISIDNIIEEIQSSSVEERLCGLQSLATLAENPESVDTIVKHKVLKIIAPLLVDGSSEVRNLTAGVLRNLSANGTVLVIELLVKDDIMTPLVALLHQYTEWNPETAKAEDTNTLLQLVNLLWNLCEQDETALKHFNSANLLNILLRCLNYETVGLDLSISVCQCLISVTEDNTTLTTALRHHESDFLRILAVTSTDQRLLLLKTLAAGILVNLNPSSSCLEAVFAAVTEALDVDTHQQISQLSSELPLDAPAQPSEDTLTLLSNTRTLVDAQAMALEILTNLISSQDDEMDVESEESVSDEEELNGWTEGDETQLLGLSSEVYEALKKYKLAKTVYLKTASLPANVMDIIITCVQSRALAKRVERLQCSAYLCLNNLVSVGDMEQFGGPSALYDLVKNILKQRLCFNPQQSVFEWNKELVEAATAAIRAILLRLASIKFSDLGEIYPSDIEEIFKIGMLPEPQVQVNVVRIIGTLGVMLVTNACIVETVGIYLLQAVERQPVDLWLVAEALDSLMDVFAEDCTDQMAAEVNLVPRLQALTPRLKSKMRQERKMLGENYPLVSTVMTNLMPFIKYKGTRVAALDTH